MRLSKRAILVVTASYTFARRIANKQTHTERVFFLVIGILANFGAGLAEATACRLFRGSPAHTQWSFLREILYGASRRVLTWAGHLFERDPDSYSAWTSISEALAYFPAKHLLPTQGLGSLYFDAGQESRSKTAVPCAAVFLSENRARVEEQLLGGKHDPDLVYILHAHGGGYVAGGLYASQSTSIDFLKMKHLNPDVAERLVYVHIDYTLGIEQRYPRAVIDSALAFDWLLSRGVRGDQIFLQGESGGGGLAACTAIALRDNPPFLHSHRSEIAQYGEQPAGAILLSPMVDVTHDFDYPEENEALDIIGGKLARGCARHYCDHNLTKSPYATPFYSDNLGQLPPILMQTGAIEIFDLPCRLLAEKIEAHGTEIVHERYDGMPHCFQILAGAGCPHARDALGSIYSFIEAKAPKRSQT